MKGFYKLDEMDLEFILGVQDCLEHYYMEQATEVLLKSSFLKRLKEDTEYVYHYDERYWAQVIKSEYESKQMML